MKLQARNFVVRKPETIDITMFFKKFCIATRTKASNLGSRLFCWCVGYGTTRIIKSGKRSFLLDSKEVPWPIEGVGATIGRPPT